MRFLVLPISRRHQIWHPIIDSTSPFFPSPTAAANSGAAARYVDKGVAWGTSQWEALGQKKEGSISHKIYVYGNKLLDKIDSDETFLKTVPPLPGALKEDGLEKVVIPVTLPTRIDPTTLATDLHTLLSHRIPYHTRYTRASAL
ncbi:hypothetical protein HK097_005650, partial [Rhizophlyctis rosea]